MQKETTPITLSGCVYLKSIIVIQSATTTSNTVFDAVKGHWQIPNFSDGQVNIARPELITKMSDKLHTTHEFTKILRITGELGIGKTHLALQFAHQHYQSQYYQSIIWMNAQDYHADTLEAQWMHLAAAMGLEFTQDTKLHDIISQTYQRILQQGRCLLIFDNAECYDILAPYLKYNDPKLHIVITSRNGIHWTYQDVVIEVPLLTEPQATQYLRQSELQQSTTTKDLNPPIEAKEIFRHPLVLKELCKAKHQHSGSSLSFQSQFDFDAVRDNEFAYQLLQYCALLAPYENISLQFLNALYNNDNDMDVCDAMCILKERGFIGYTIQANTYYIPVVISHIAKPKDIITPSLKLLQTALEMVNDTTSTLLQKHVVQFMQHIFINLANTTTNEKRLEKSGNSSSKVQSFVESFNQYLSAPNQQQQEPLLNQAKSLL